MITQTTAIVRDGVLHPDAPLELPDETRVRVTIEPVVMDQESRLAALKRLQQLIKDRPINSGGLRYTREELHERR